LLHRTSPLLPSIDTGVLTSSLLMQSL
jgi:hypothetical protein